MFHQRPPQDPLFKKHRIGWRQATKHVSLINPVLLLPGKKVKTGIDEVNTHPVFFIDKSRFASDIEDWYVIEISNTRVFLDPSLIRQARKEECDFRTGRYCSNGNLQTLVTVLHIFAQRIPVQHTGSTRT